jgi:hypothetical protein
LRQDEPVPPQQVGIIDDRRGDLRPSAKVKASCAGEAAEGRSSAKEWPWRTLRTLPLLLLGFALPFAALVTLVASFPAIALGSDRTFGDRVVAGAFPATVAEAGAVANVSLLSLVFALPFLSLALARWCSGVACRWTTCGACGLSLASAFPLLLLRTVTRVVTEVPAVVAKDVHVDGRRKGEGLTDVQTPVVAS